MEGSLGEGACCRRAPVALVRSPAFTHADSQDSPVCSTRFRRCDTTSELLRGWQFGARATGTSKVPSVVSPSPGSCAFTVPLVSETHPSTPFFRRARYIRRGDTHGVRCIVNEHRTIQARLVPFCRYLLPVASLGCMPLLPGPYLTSSEPECVLRPVSWAGTPLC